MNNEITIQKLEKDDLKKFAELVKLFEDVFEMKDFSIPANEHLQKVLGGDSFDVFVALQDDKVVGGLTVYILAQYYSERQLAYIFDLAVDVNLQRKGIGKKLIAATKQFYKAKGFEEVFVQADKEDEHAVNFYGKTDPTVAEQVVHFYYILNK